MSMVAVVVTQQPEFTCRTASEAAARFLAGDGHDIRNSAVAAVIVRALDVGIDRSALDW
jgi:hypothetical protein